MRVLYIANIRLPTEKAHGIQIMKMCEAFSGCGARVTLLVPRRLNHISENPFSYYSVMPVFNIIRLPTIDLVFLGHFGFLIQSLSFAVSALLYSVFFNKVDIVYGRDELQLLFQNILSKNIVWEIHAPRTNYAARAVSRASKLAVVVTRSLSDFYVKQGIPKEKLLVAPDGVDFSMFDIKDDRKGARIKLGIPLSDKIVLYTGHFYVWKGTDTLGEASGFLPDDVNIYFVGGTEEGIRIFKKKFGGKKNIRILGKKSYSDIPLYLKAADILVIPNSAKEDISLLYTSPMKLFEYMASGTPMLASDIPAIREVVSENEVFFAEPDNPRSFAEKIKEIFEPHSYREEKAAAARDAVREHTWEKRAARILAAIKL